MDLMSDFAKEIIPVNLEDEMKQSYLDYAMSVIIGRALPDVRDGLKPVHRRVLYAMSVLNNDWNKPYKKSARVVGDVIGKYHPHGDTAVYDTMVRMAQPFSMRNMLIDGQGNFGCFTGDTRIKLWDGSEKSFAQLAKLSRGEIFKVSSFDRNTNTREQGNGQDSRITRKDAELIELTLGNGKKIRCTPDHLFLIKNESETAYKEAKDLKPEHELMPAYYNKRAVEEGLCEIWLDENQAYYHQVTNVKKLTETADVYDITVDEYHNFLLADGVLVHNSVDGDSPAAMRYTEVRMAKISHEILADLDKETVDFVSNYDDSESEPSVMPTRVPILLINGSSGIAVGMATNIPPHNLGEIISGCLALIENPEMNVAELMVHIPGPDFPTAAFINGSLGIDEAYSTGRGKVHLRAKAHFEPFGQNDSREAIIVTELPYQVNKARLLEKIGEMHKEGKLTGISALRDESDKDGMRMVIELKRGEVAEVILNNLYKQTQLQTVFGINMVAILNGRPYCMNLKEILNAFINHRREVVTRRTLYLLRKARDRAHILEGLGIALSNIDEMITLIKASKNSVEAREGLLERDWKTGLVMALLEDADMTRSRPEELPDDFGINGKVYKLSPTQAQAILELRLHRLTGLEQDKIITEFKQLLGLIDEYLFIITHDERLMEIITEELVAIKEHYADPRRTVILQDRLSLSTEDLITEEERVVTMSHEGYVKSQPLDDYKAQRRGGRGKSATKTKEEDFIEKLIIANTHDTILCFSSTGKVYGVKVYTLPVASRSSRGKPFVNVLPLEKGEKISAMLTVREFSEDKFIFMATANGTVKKTPLKEFKRQPINGKIALDLREGNSLVGVAVTDGQQNVLLFSSNGKVICFNELDVRSMGRTAAGVRGIRLKEGQRIISLIIGSEGTVLNITENGFGKRTLIEKYNCQKRGGQGVIAIQTSERNGAVVGALLVNDNDEIMLITDGGTLVRTRVSEISVIGRNAQGVTVIRPDSGEKVVGVDKIDGLQEDDDVDLEVDDIELEVIEDKEIEPEPTSE
jgi:DNA gyrase subunit A